MKKPPRPRDTNQLGKAVVELATGYTTEVQSEDKKNPHAVALGRLGGLKGGKARAKKLSPLKRRKIARIAAMRRWGTERKD